MVAETGTGLMRRAFSSWGRGGVDLGDVAPRKLDHGGLPITGRHGRHEDRSDSGRPSFLECAAEIRYGIAGDFAPIRPWQVAVGDASPASCRRAIRAECVDRHPPDGRSRAPCLGLIGHDAACREAQKILTNASA